MVPSSNASRQGGSKRQRMSPPLPVTVNDLSADIWCGIANFLPKTSRALLAVALTARPASFRESGWKGQPNAVSKAIISSVKDGLLFDNLLDELCEEARVEAESGILRRCKYSGIHYSREDDFTYFRRELIRQIGKYYNSGWEVMDFVDIPASLASRLSDEDVGAVFVCIEAKYNLTRLKLTNCCYVVGTGLGPLRGSTVIQYLDLEIVRKFEEPRRRKKGSRKSEIDEIMLLEGPVFAVLDTIVGEEGNTLKRFQYPNKWVGNASEPDIIKMLYGRNQIMRAERFNEFVSDHNAVVNKFACCLYFGSVHEGDISMLLKANSAEDEANVCIGCGETSEYSNCIHCNEIICRECCETKECNDCNVRCCPSCCADNGLVEKMVTVCDNVEWCEVPYCSTCRLNSCKRDSLSLRNYCAGCRKMTFDALMEECKAKQSQIDTQWLKIERLNRDITNEEADELGDKGSPNYQTFSVEDETGLETDIGQPCPRPGCTQMMCQLCQDHPFCSGCNVRYCVTCNFHRYGVSFCRACDGDEAYCNECRLKKRKSDKNDCARCKIYTFGTLLVEYNMKEAELDFQGEEIERLMSIEVAAKQRD